MHALAQDGEFILYTMPFLWINKYVSTISNDQVSGNFCLEGGILLAATAVVVVIVVIDRVMMLTSSSTGRSLFCRCGWMRKCAEMGITPLHT
jgi:hypothetical protein